MTYDAKRKLKVQYQNNEAQDTNKKNEPYKKNPAVGFFGQKKILSTPSFGGEVKPSVRCRRFSAGKRELRFTWKSLSQVKLTGHFSPNSALP
jgi:hypothetical protein